MEPSAIFHLHPAVAIEDFESGSLALNVETLRLVELNHTAREIARRLEQGQSLGEIAAAIAKDYAQPVNTVLADVTEVIEQLLALEIIQPGAATEGE